MEKVTKLSDRRQEISLLDKIAAYQKLIRTPGLDPYARTVAMFICDKTVGFGKVSDTIPVGQIMKGTNIGRTRLFETLDFLRGQGIISTEQNGRGLHVTFMRSWEPEILPIPKRLQDKTSPPDEHQKSATRTSEVRYADIRSPPRGPFNRYSSNRYSFNRSYDRHGEPCRAASGNPAEAGSKRKDPGAKNIRDREPQA